MVAARAQPIAWAQARPLIETLLQQQQRAERVQQALADLRRQADVEYRGTFAQSGGGRSTATP